MQSKFKYIVKYALFWLVLFVLARLFFTIYNIDKTSKLAISDLILSFLHGFKLDLSMMGYVLVLPLLLLALFMHFKTSVFRIFMRYYTLVFLILFVVVIFIDAELYRNWGFRIDSTIMLYIKTPKESIASVTIWLILLLLSGIIISVLSLNKFYAHFVEKTLFNVLTIKWHYFPVFVLLSGLMIIPIRGGFGIAPINPGSVFFSKNNYANHLALNCIWNLGNSLSTMNRKQTIKFMDDELAKKHFKNKFGFNDKPELTRLINKKKPNVIIIVLESFNNGVIESLGGINASPNLTRIAQEGVLFSNFYANGDRSDKGIVSILSGYPAQPTTSIIKFTSKAEKLPHLSKKMAALGYSTGFYYGGEINFANMNSYFVSGGYDDLVTLDQFTSSDLNSKWGAHDHVVFNRFYKDLENTEQPFFRTLFTLSSHEPFDVPHKSKFNSFNDESKYLNSINYTDSCLGDFINKARNTTWWDNTLIIFVSDHGSRWPGNVSYNSTTKFKIPMIWTGGAINSDTIITAACSQIDIPLMIGNQLGEKFSEFKFSKDVLNKQNSFAFYAFNNGFGFINDTSTYIYDNTANAELTTIKTSANFKQAGKAFMQHLLNDFNSK